MCYSQILTLKIISEHIFKLMDIMLKKIFEEKYPYLIIFQMKILMLGK